jgi:hypothetical protein
VIQLRIEEETALMDLLRGDTARAREKQRRIELAAEHNESVLCRELRRQRNEERKMNRFLAIGWLLQFAMFLTVMWFNARGWPGWLS